MLRLRLTFDAGFPAPLSGRLPLFPPAAASWPFSYPLDVAWPEGPVAVHVPGLQEAFVNRQSAGMRLVTTRAAYLMHLWEDLAGSRDVVMVATAHRETLLEHAPEMLSGRGLFSSIEVVESGQGPLASARGYQEPGSPSDPAVASLIAAMRATDPSLRLALCVQALAAGRTPAALVATASVCMEVNDLAAAERDLEEALAKAPAWAAAHFERGKLWLRRDDMERASESFRAAAEGLPRFASAWSNLGAALGELDRPHDALKAFTHALECDPDDPQTHNNIGVVSRELGQLAESEAAFRRVLELAPDLAFGYYNLGHTLFLQGRYRAALSAYAEGQKRDRERNPVQASRLAICRLATGDPVGALDELRRATGRLPPDDRRQLLADAHNIVWALLTHRPDLPGWQAVNDWLTGELSR